VADNSIESLFARLRRFPDVEAANLQAWDATDRLLLETALEMHAAGMLAPGARLAVVGDRYGALTLGALTLGAGTLGAEAVRVHQDLVTGERALRANAEALAIDAGFEHLPLGAGLLEGASLVLLQLPRSLAELEEIADAVARYAAPDVVLLAGGRVKHWTSPK
jgi:16S rRNA (guanine1207-N2)-methyltransferase